MRKHCRRTMKSSRRTATHCRRMTQDAHRTLKTVHCAGCQIALGRTILQLIWKHRLRQFNPENDKQALSALVE
jgi:hypothetical protein